MRIIVTGATGFIAGSLIRRLSSDPNVEIAAVSRRPVPLTGRHGSVVADLSNWGWTKALPSAADIVVHFAQSTRYKEFPDGGPDMVRINLDSTAELLDWSRSHGVSRFVLASSGSVYDPSTEAHREEDRCRATDMYSATKLAAEQIAQSYADLFRMLVLRLFNIYGPGQQAGLFHSLVSRVRGCEPIALAGGHGIFLSPLFIADATDALARLIAVDVDTGVTTLNLAGDRRCDLRDVAEAIGNAGGWSPRFEIAPDPPRGLVGDISKLRALLDWRPSTDLENGVQRMVEGGGPIHGAGTPGRAASPISASA